MIGVLASQRRTAVAASVEDTMQQGPVAICRQHLDMIGQALAAYERDHGEPPGHRSDLHPDYGSDPAAFHRPADASAGNPGPSWAPIDAKLPISYFYEMSVERLSPDLVDIALGLGPERLRSGATWREAKRLDRYHFGDRVPVVSCWHHEKGRLFLLPSGQVYGSWRRWEDEPAVHLEEGLRRDRPSDQGKACRVES
jgi:hypothetical protein